MTDDPFMKIEVRHSIIECSRNVHNPVQKSIKSCRGDLLFFENRPQKITVLFIGPWTPRKSHDKKILLLAFPNFNEGRNNFSGGQITRGAKHNKNKRVFARC